ncbi:MAG: hypothetical protein SWK76_13885 [Actinomycetota bacterium]|nr:hypothetical protein [Actinomycetota bacterium]
MLGKVEVNIAAIEVIWNSVFRSLMQITWAFFALGAVVALGSAVAGPYKWATWLREKRRSCSRTGGTAA